jgi:hypothetical protein
MLVKDFLDEYARYRAIGEKAMGQVSTDALNRVVAPDGNSIAMIVRHLSGNLVSRFTDFLTADGEKSWRNRDDEFADGPFSRAAVDDAWAKGWQVLEREVGALGDDDLRRTVTIRGVPHTVHEALSRSVTHASYHVGQIVLLARMLATDEWKWITIPKNQSRQYNANPVHEKGPVR